MDTKMLSPCGWDLTVDIFCHCVMFLNMVSACNIDSSGRWVTERRDTRMWVNEWGVGDGAGATRVGEWWAEGGGCLVTEKLKIFSILQWRNNENVTWNLIHTPNDWSAKWVHSPMYNIPRRVAINLFRALVYDTRDDVLGYDIVWLEVRIIALVGPTRRHCEFCALLISAQKSRLQDLPEITWNDEWQYRHLLI